MLAVIAIPGKVPAGVRLSITHPILIVTQQGDWLEWFIYLWSAGQEKAVESFRAPPNDLIAPTVGDFDCDGRKHCRVTRQKYSLFALA